MGAVSYIDENKSFSTYRLPLIQRYGTSKELYSRLRYAKTMTERLITKLDAQPAREGATPLLTTPIVQPTPTPVPA